MRIDLQSPFSIEVCVDRIVRTSDRDTGVHDAAGSRPVIAMVQGTRFRLRKRRLYWHSLAPELYCKLERARGGTSVRCKPKIALVPKMFTLVFFGVLGFMTFDILDPVFTGELREASGSASDVLIPLGFLTVLFGFGVGLVWSGHRIGKREMPQLQAYLAKTLSAEPAGGYADTEPVATAGEGDEPQALPRPVYLACVAGMLLSLGVHVLMLFGIDLPGVVAFLFVAALLTFVFVLLTISRRAEAVGLLRFEDVQEALLSRFPQWFSLASRIFGLYFVALFAWPLLGGGEDAIGLLFSLAPAWFFGGTALILRSWGEITREGVEA